jgi:alpha-tubulin suppressor-like RCC1 family protein
VAAGAQHSLVLCKDGTLRAWGKDFGQLSIPTEVSSSKVKAIAAGAYHNLAIMDTGALVAWGTYDDTTLVMVPPELYLNSSSNQPVIAISAGYDFSLALTADGAVHAFGINPSGVLEVPARAKSGVKAIAAGFNHSVALLASGELVTWGSTSLGQTQGVPNTTTPVADQVEASWAFTYVLTRISGSDPPPPPSPPPSSPLPPSPPPSPPPSNSTLPSDSGTIPAEGCGTFEWGNTDLSLALQRGVVAISASWDHVLMLKADGSVIAFGFNPQGQTYVPSDKIKNLAVAVAAGANHSLVLLSDGTVIGFGGNTHNQIDPLPPEVLPGGSGAISIAAGRDFSLFVLRDGSVIGIGRNFLGEINIPQAARSDVVAVSSSGMMNAALKASGELIVWGFNNSETGNGLISDVPPEIAAVGVANVSVGLSHIAVILKNGQAAIWGDNSDGQTTFPNGVTPKDVKAIAAGGWHTVLLTKQGQVHAIGSNLAGQTTVPSSVNSATEAGTSGLAVAVAAGWSTSWALRPLKPEEPVPGMCHAVEDSCLDTVKHLPLQNLNSCHAVHGVAHRCTKA